MQRAGKSPLRRVAGHRATSQTPTSAPPHRQGSRQRQRIALFVTARPRPRPEGIATSRAKKGVRKAGRPWSADKAETPVVGFSVPDTSRQVRDTVELEKTKAPTEAGATTSGPVRGSTAEAEGDPLLQKRTDSLATLSLRSSTVCFQGGRPRCRPHSGHRGCFPKQPIQPGNALPAHGS